MPALVPLVPYVGSAFFPLSSSEQCVLRMHFTKPFTANFINSAKELRNFMRALAFLV